MQKVIFTAYFSLFLLTVQAQDLLQAGPMVGYSEMQEVMLWVQTRQEAQVQLEYWDNETPHKLLETSTYKTEKTHAFTAHLLADAVEPGRKYTYRVLINGKEVKRAYPFQFQTPPLWQYRTEPPEMKIALGSCAYINEKEYDRPGNAYGSHYEIFTAISQQKPDMMLWLGDNTYLREPDWYSKTGMFHRYTHTRSLPEMQPLLASSINLAVWDDHDYGPNDSDRTFVKKELSEQVFQDFWANPTYGLPNMGGTTSMYEYGDAHFFLLDNRYFRTANEAKTASEKICLGKAQIDWLIEALVSSKATFKFVCVGGQILNPVKMYETLANLSATEYEEIIARIEKENLKNVIFLTGDRHHSELSMKELANGQKIYDWTVSPLTSGTHEASKEENTLRVKNSYIGVHNFGTIQIKGKRKERIAYLSLFDSEGKELWKYEIKAQ
ncbi:MAG: alkaline phosphatase D family protein [Bacteroidia bacterium]